MCVIEVWTGWELKDGWEGFEHLKDDELYLFKGNGTHELVGEIGELLSNCQISWHAEIPLFECLGDFYIENDDEAFDFGSYRERLDLIKSRSDYHKLYESSFVKIKRKL